MGPGTTGGLFGEKVEEYLRVWLRVNRQKSDVIVCSGITHDLVNQASSPLLRPFFRHGTERIGRRRVVVGRLRGRPISTWVTKALVRKAACDSGPGGLANSDEYVGSACNPNRLAQRWRLCPATPVEDRLAF